MPRAPRVASLVRQFKLKERGRDRGQHDLPSTESPRLDIPETEVIAHCEDLVGERLTEYNGHRAKLEGRIRTPVRNSGGEKDVKQVCLDADHGRRFRSAEIEYALFSPVFGADRRRALEGDGWICRDLADFARVLAPEEHEEI